MRGRRRKRTPDLDVERALQQYRRDFHRGMWFGSGDMGDMLDAVEWDWPRWGRRILVSRNVKVGDPLTPAELARATIIYQPYPHARHIEIGWAHDG